jgi:hypothetical protein
MSYRTRFRVRAVPWHDYENSGQSCAELEAESGARVRVFVDGFDVAEGDLIDAELFPFEITTHPVDAFDGFDALFRANARHEYRCEPIGEWDCIFAGKIVALTPPPSGSQDATPTAIVDCGGIYVRLDGLTHDERVVGEWVQFTGSRVELMDPRPVPPSQD